MKDEWIRFGYQKNYRNPGRVNIHPELEINGIQNWILGIVDLFEAYEFSMNLRKNYWEIRPQIVRETVRPLYDNQFEYNNRKFPLYTAQEATLGLRFAYGEKRSPFLGFYFSSGTKYPLFYSKLTAGKLSAGDYTTSYARVSAALTWTKRLNRWGKDMITLEGGFIHSFDGKPLPRSYLFSGTGMDVRKINFYTHGAFLTMRPFDYYNDRYFAVFYKHDFDRYFWDKSFSKPFLSLAHNLSYGTLRDENMLSNGGLNSFSKGYHESGILLNQLIRKDLNFADAYLGGGYFYHWTPQYRKENGTWVVVVGFSF